MTFNTLHTILKHLPLPSSGRGICASIIVLATTSMANAQTFLDDLRSDKTGQGKVTITESKEIDQLVNGKASATTSPKVTTLVPPSASAQNTPDQQTSAPAASEQTPSSSHDAAEKPSLPAPPTAPSKPTQSVSEPELNETIVDTRKKVMRKSYKTTGYRIQVYSGGNSRIDRQKAETAGAVMKSNFPSEPIYVHFYSPSWKCRMGNYRSIDEARRLLAKVKKLGYPQANIVKGTISVQY